MMKRVLALFCCLFLMAPVMIAFAETTDEADSEFDLSEEQQRIEELGIPTVSSVATMKAEADELWNNKDYEAAAIAYSEYAEQANWLANIISAGLEPYYSASYDDRDNWYPDELSFTALATAETTSNSYKSERNRAMLYEGLCYYYLNDYESALPLLINALELIEIEDEENWGLGMEALYSIVGYNS